MNKKNLRLTIFLSAILFSLSFHLVLAQDYGIGGNGDDICSSSQVDCGGGGGSSYGGEGGSGAPCTCPNDPNISMPNGECDLFCPTVCTDPQATNYTGTEPCYYTCPDGTQEVSPNNLNDCPTPTPPSSAPTISWTSAPSSADCDASYTISAAGHDDSGNMNAVSINKNGSPFAYAGGGDGTDGTSGNSTSDTGPQTVTYTAWANNSAGQQSPTISTDVSIGSCTPPPPTTCLDGNASNYGQPLPCTYPPELCEDPSATNYAQSLPCQYPQTQYCNDPSATNYGGIAPCTYPPQSTMCEDNTANNYGGPLPCTYSETGNNPPTNGGGNSPGNNPPNNNPPNNNPSSGFTLTGPSSANVQFLGSAGGTTGISTLAVNPTGGFDSPVTISVQSTSCQYVTGYSFDGEAVAQSPSAAMTYNSQYSAYTAPSGDIGLNVQIQFSSAFTNSCDVIFSATGGGSSATFDLPVSPNSFNPSFKEI